MNKHQAKIEALWMAASLLRADLHQGGVSAWPDLDEKDIGKVEDAVEELAEQLARRARKLKERDKGE